MAVVIGVEGLRVIYGSMVAVDNVSFEVQEGEILGMLGPNGAGKTSTIECIEGLRKPAGGRVRVLGLDPFSQRKQLHRQVGVQLQETAFPDRLKVNELCRLFSSFYSDPAPYAAIIENLGLGDKQNAYISKLSGGQKQRLALALALLPRPRVLFLDELTTGLDPRARRHVWEMIHNLRSEGMTMILATHFMEEAQQLCDRVAVMNRGKIVALDSPSALIASCAQGDKVIFEVHGNLDERGLMRLDGVTGVERSGRRVVVTGGGAGLVERVAGYLRQSQCEYSSFQCVPSTLEDVFLRLTGTRLANEEEDNHEAVV